MFRIRITKRQEPRGWSSCLVLVAAIALSLVLSGILLSLRGTPPLDGLAVLFKGAFGSRFAIEDCLIKAIPIFLCSLGVAVAFRLQIWNIGAEGQFALGAVGATWVALTFPDLPGYLLLPAMIAMAALAGGLWGLIPAILRQRLQTNEIIVTLMLNYIAILFLDYLVYGVWKDPTSFGFPMTSEFSAAGRCRQDRLDRASTGAWPIAWSSVRWSGSSSATPVSVSSSRRPATASGRPAMPASPMTGWSSWSWSSAGHWPAGPVFSRPRPPSTACSRASWSGYGYTAIVVAWLARLNPLSIAVASFLLAGLRVGVENLQLDLQVPAAFGGIIEGLILLTVLAGGLFTSYRLAVRRK